MSVSGWLTSASLKSNSDDPFDPFCTGEGAGAEEEGGKLKEEAAG